MIIMTKISKETLVGDAVRDNFERARVFESHGIDYCCGGDVPIGVACVSVHLDANRLINELKSTSARVDRSSTFIENLPPAALSDYIVKVHHSYVREQIPFLLEKLHKLCEVHGNHHPELLTIKEMFITASDNLMAHMKKEEEILFPAIARLAESGSGDKISSERAAQLTRPVRDLKKEHQAEGDRFREMDRMTDHFRVPPDGCNTYHITYNTLREFIADLHRHIHLENNILFPETEKLEK